MMRNYVLLLAFIFCSFFSLQNLYSFEVEGHQNNEDLATSQVENNFEQDSETKPGKPGSKSGDQGSEPGPEPGTEPAFEDQDVEPYTEAAAGDAGSSIFDSALVLSYYGHPLSKYMGILGEDAISKISEELCDLAQEYDALLPELRVIPAFHIIYGTVYEDADIGYLRKSALLSYIEYAEENDMLVFLDHQLGKYEVAESIRGMLPYLHYPSVHLAIDPEWSTEKPGKEIGSIHAREVNEAQQMIQDYLEEEGIPGKKILVLHQFNWKMIEDRHLVRSDFERVDLVHNADGFGSPRHKYKSWDHNTRAENMPLKGFKLFYPKSWRDGGFDDPLLSPAEVLALKPRPVLVMYQ